MTELDDEAARLEAARSLVIRTEGAVQKSVPLDSYVPLLDEIKECQRMEAFWKERLARLRTSLAGIMGSAEIGTVNGEEAVTYEPTARFNGSAFKKQYPNLSKAFMHTVEKSEWDLDLLRKSRPDLYAQFQVRPILVKYEPPGALK